MIDVILYIVLASPLPEKQPWHSTKKTGPRLLQRNRASGKFVWNCLEEGGGLFQQFYANPLQDDPIFSRKYQSSNAAKPRLISGLRLGVYFWASPSWFFCYDCYRPLTSDDLQDYDITLGPAFGVSAWTCVRSWKGWKSPFSNWGKTMGGPIQRVDFPSSLLCDFELKAAKRLEDFRMEKWVFAPSKICDAMFELGDWSHFSFGQTILLGGGLGGFTPCNPPGASLSVNVKGPILVWWEQSWLRDCLTKGADPELLLNLLTELT